MQIQITEQQLNDVSTKENISYDVVLDNADIYKFKFFLDNKQIGFISFQTSTLQNKKIAEIRSSSITKFRNQGYGLLMYKTFINYLKDQNFDLIQSDNTIQHNAIHAIWQKLGAEWDDTNKQYVLDLG